MTEPKALSPDELAEIEAHDTDDTRKLSNDDLDDFHKAFCRAVIDRASLISHIAHLEAKAAAPITNGAHAVADTATPEPALNTWGDSKPDEPTPAFRRLQDGGLFLDCARVSRNYGRPQRPKGKP